MHWNLSLILLTTKLLYQILSLILSFLIRIENDEPSLLFFLFIFCCSSHILFHRVCRVLSSISIIIIVMCLNKLFYGYFLQTIHTQKLVAGALKPVRVWDMMKSKGIYPNTIFDTKRFMLHICASFFFYHYKLLNITDIQIHR